MPTEPTGRRPLKTREWPFFKNLAAALARSGATPNGISFASIVCGCCAGAALAETDVADWPMSGVTLLPNITRWFWLAAAVFIQLRLIANLLDGMVAVEGRKGGPTGDLWNEAPDRVSDAAIFIGAGYASGSAPVLGLAAALVSVFVAYVRALGASVGAGQCFLGPMAKPHRMALMTTLALAGTLFPQAVASSVRTFFDHPLTALLTDSCRAAVGAPLTVVSLALLLVILGGLITAWRRLAFIADFLRKKSQL
ncbi:MAG: CDP-alcohol phosphatidyltransferase family protein [Chthoniobacter sp.]|nr:CDP-alcohol phosphatidyltransferase family protein [Chthoniobacter sp.]